MTEERCETCRFWKSQDGGLWCRRFPIYVVGKRPDEWCGEWQAKREAGITPTSQQERIFKALGKVLAGDDPEWDGSPIKTGPARYKVKASWAAAHGNLVPVDSLQADLDVIRDLPEKPKAREPGWYWVDPGDPHLEWWSGKKWHVNKTTDYLPEDAFVVIDECRIERQP